MPRIFSNWLKAYMDYTDASEAPSQFHFWTGVSTIAGALRRKVWTDHKIFKTSPNFYLVFVGPAGVVTKSTTIDLGLDLLSKVEGVHIGPPSATWQGLLSKSFLDAKEIIEYLDDNGQAAKLECSCITLAVSELGTFLKMSQDGLAEVLIDLWDTKANSRSFGHVTKTQGDLRVTNPWLNLIAGTTTAWLRENFPESQIGGGLTSRIIFVYGEKKRQLVAYPELVWTKRGQPFEKLQADLITDLKEIAKLVGRYHITPDAYKWGETWYLTHNTKRPAHLLSDRYDAYLARKQASMHKLAMVLSAARSDDMRLTEAHLDEANTILTEAETAMLRVYESIGNPQQARFISTICGYVRGLGKVSAQDLWSRCINLMEYEDFQSALKAAIEAKLLRVIMVGTDAAGRVIKGVELV